MIIPNENLSQYKRWTTVKVLRPLKAFQESWMSASYKSEGSDTLVIWASWILRFRSKTILQAAKAQMYGVI